MKKEIDSRMSSAWRIVDDTHPITRAAIQVIIDDYENKLSRLRELHKTDEPYWGATDARSVTADKLITPCYHCGQEYPCDTIKVLDGKTE
jgi:hypothetical protein